MAKKQTKKQATKRATQPTMLTEMLAVFHKTIHTKEDRAAMQQACDDLNATDPKDAEKEIRAKIKSLADEIGYSPKSLGDVLRRKGFRYITELNLHYHLLETNRLTPKIEAFSKRVQDANATSEAPIGAADTETGDLETPEQMCEFYRKRLETALTNDDFHNIKLYSDLHLKTSESIRRNEIHATKVGLKSGDVMTRAEVERIMKAALYAGNACVHLQLSSICERLAGISDPGELYHVLKPALVGDLIFSGFSKAKGIGVPDWFIDLVKQEAKSYVGNSECLWEDQGKS